MLKDPNGGGLIPAHDPNGGRRVALPVNMIPRKYGRNTFTGLECAGNCAGCCPVGRTN